MLELIIDESFPLNDVNKYIDVVVSVAKQCGDQVLSFPVVIEFDFYCRNVFEHPHVVSADGHKYVVGALVVCGVLPSPRWKYVSGFIDTFHIDEKDPRLVVRIV